MYVWENSGAEIPTFCTLYPSSHPFFCKIMKNNMQYYVNVSFLGFFYIVLIHIIFHLHTFSVVAPTPSLSLLSTFSLKRVSSPPSTLTGPSVSHVSMNHLLILNLVLFFRMVLPLILLLFCGRVYYSIMSSIIYYCILH